MYITHNRGFFRTSDLVPPDGAGTLGAEVGH